MKFDNQYFQAAQDIILDVLRANREELLLYHGVINHETKSDNSVVTNMDKKLEVAIKDALRKYDAGVGFLGEEHGQEGDTHSFWLIDPIDGTESYIRGLSGCRNILTFVDGNEPIYALVNRFTTNDLFIAQRGHPTTKNGVPVTLSTRPLNRAWLEFSVDICDAKGYKIYQSIKPRVASLTLHHDFLEILEGAIEGIVVYHSGGDVWDYAPRALLVEGAGGRVTNIGSDKYDYKNKSLLATSPEIFDEITVLLSRAV